MAVNLSPVGGVAAQFFDNSGNVLTGGLLYSYLAGTTTPAVTYTSSSGITAQPNPIVLDAAGRVPNSGEIWLTDGISYKFVLKDQNTVQIGTWDNVVGINSNFIAYTGQSEVATATQGQTVFTLTTIQYQPGTNSLAVYVNGSKQVSGTNYQETSSTAVTFIDGLNVGDIVEFDTAESIATNAVSAINVSYIDGGTGSVYRSVASKLQESISVKDFGAVGDGIVDDTTAIQAAIDYAKSFIADQTELTIMWPAGTYNVTTLNYVGAERVTNQSLGAVNIIGTATGGTSIINVDGATSTFTRNLNWQGLFTISQGVGSAYSYGVYISGLVGGRWVMTVSGGFTLNTVYINYSFNNPQLDFTASNSSGLAIATIFCDSNSVNQNSFNCRTTGSSNMTVASIGLYLQGNANKVTGDFSSSQIGIQVNAARGTTISSPYMEAVKYGVLCTSNPLGTTVVGGLYEVGSSGAAFDLASCQNTTVIGPRIFGVAGGTSRTAFSLETGCYGLNVLSPDIDATTIDTISSGTYRGNQLPSQFNVLDAQWLSFPTTQVPSTDVNTLDDYKEGSWTPVSNGDAYTTATGKYTKIGNVVYASFQIQFPSTSNGLGAQFTNLPYNASSSFSEQNGLSVGYNTASFAISGSLATATFSFRRNGSATGVTNANLSGAFITGVITYFAA